MTTTETIPTWAPKSFEISHYEFASVARRSIFPPHKFAFEESREVRAIHDDSEDVSFVLNVTSAQGLSEVDLWLLLNMEGVESYIDPELKDDVYGMLLAIASTLQKPVSFVFLDSGFSESMELVAHAALAEARGATLNQPDLIVLMSAHTAFSDDDGELTDAARAFWKRFRFHNSPYGINNTLLTWTEPTR